MTRRWLILTGATLVVAVAVLFALRGGRRFHVVFIAGESEYGAAESLPALAASLRETMGIDATVLIAPEIVPENDEGGRLPDLAALADADLAVLFLRFREDGPQRDALEAYIASGRPVIALRTTSHAFAADRDWFPPVFGGHYKGHAPNDAGTTALVVPDALDEPIVRGLAGQVDMGYGGTYTAQPLADSADALLLGKTGDLPAEPIGWVSATPYGGRVFYTSLGTRENFAQPAFQALLHNAVAWALGEPVPADGILGRMDGAPVPREARPVPAVPALRAPADATVLFDGRSLDAWRHWDPAVAPRAIEIDERADTSGAGPAYDAARWRLFRGAMRPILGQGDVMTRESYGSYLLHVDFLVPEEPAYVQPPFRGNSGVFVQGRYEVQIADSHGREPGVFSCGAINGVAAPLVDAARPAGEWQSLEIACEELPRAPARLSVWLNGVLVQSDVEVDEPTIYGALAAPSDGEALFVADRAIPIGVADVTVLARFRADGDGTIFARAPAEGPWAPNAKAVFLRGGRLMYDIGWVGVIDAGTGCDDGEWHTLGFVYRGGVIHLYVDGELRVTDDDFSAEDVEDHVFKIGTASPNFAGTLDGDVERVIVYDRALPEAEIEAHARGAESGTEALLDWTAPRSSPRMRDDTDAGAIGPIRLQADSARVRFANVWLRPLPEVDHAALCRDVTEESIERGRKIYERVCMSCHGSRDHVGTLPTSRRFHEQPLEAGADPYSMYQTISRGYEQMLPQVWMNPQQKYDVIHYVREAILKEHNPSQYVAVTTEYLAGLPKGSSRLERATEGAGGPDETYLHMDYGPSLNWTLEVEPGNIAYKGIAVRLDEGPGGIARGRSFVLYDHDTMRVAAMWQGDFVDWRGIAFDGSHQTHTAIAGDTVFVNPVGPGWARPGTDDFEDQRLRGRDDKPYGPLPRDWVRYRGLSKHGATVVLHYTVGTAVVLETPSMLGDGVLVRSFEMGSTTTALTMRIAPEAASVVVAGGHDLQTEVRSGFHVIDVPANSPPQSFRVFTSDMPQGLLAERADAAPAAPDIRTLVEGGPDRWPEALAVQGERDVAGAWPDAIEDGPYVVDSLAVPRLNPWHAWMRLGGFDFFPGGDRAAVCTWNGDVWLVSGIDESLELVVWKRIAAGLFQPLGVKIIDDVIHVGCRDQIVRLHDLNGDESIDFFECFNNDHQVTEHFHEFAMGLETDRAGDFYYAKSARHAKTALVPHHGTLLRVAADGARTDIVANGFRAANGVCVNDDGTFFVTDQEGHWTPKNRINWVRPGGYYGNYMGYHDRGPEDEAMEQPLVWLTNEFDRSPAELLWAEGTRWGPVEGGLLAVSYGMGQVFIVPHERAGDLMQGGQAPLPIPTFPTGVMRGRFNERDGQLYVCGLFGWAGNRVEPGGFYRVRYTGGEVVVPVGLHAIAEGIDVTFAAALDRAFVEMPGHYTVTVWNLQRTANYGSGHHDEHEVDVTAARLLDDGRTLRLTIPTLRPTWGMKVEYTVRSVEGREVTSVFHNTIHAMPAR